MSLNLNPYPEYKDSGLPWLGEIPVHWNLLRAKYVFREIDERSATGQETHLSMSQKYGLVESSRIEDWRLQSESYIGGKLCETDDLVLNRLKAHLGVFAHAPISGVVSPDYTVLRRVRNNELRFFEYLFKTPGFNGELRKSTKGIVEGFWRLYTDDLYRIRVPVPPDREQRKIISWLDKFSRLVNQFIDGKQRLIELLNEQKQGIIQQAVTHGIDSGARMKQTGLDWLPEVPEHWEMQPLKRWAWINDEVLSEATNPMCKFRYLDIGAVGTGTLTEQPELMSFGNSPSRARRVLRKGDTIISTVRTYLKAVYFVAGEHENLVASTGFAVLTPGPNIVPEYLSFVIQSNNFVERIMASSVGTAYPAISEARLGRMHVAMPPSNYEQASIIEHINSDTQAIDKAISHARREIELLREYRTRLISDVVTGKLDVRDVELPDVEGESEDLPSIELGDDDTGELLTAEGVSDVNL